MRWIHIADICALNSSVTFKMMFMKMSQNFFVDVGQNLQVIHSILYTPPNRPKSSSGKVLIPATIIMIIKFS